MRNNIFKVCRMIVFLLLDNEPLAINTIAKQIKVNWKTAKKAVKFLMFFGILNVVEVKSKNWLHSIRYTLSKEGKVIVLLRKIQKGRRLNEQGRVFEV